MRNKIVTAAMALAAPALMLGAMPASAAPTFDKAPKAQAAHTESAWEHSKKDRRYYRDGRSRNYYAAPRRAYYGEPVNYRTRAWRGNDGRYYCKKENGTTGLLIGGAAGALAGHQIAGSGDRTLGALLGAAGGALLGRAIDLSDSSCR